MEREHKTLLISDLLGETIFSDKAKKASLAKIAKQTTIFSFWEDIAGKKYAKFTKPYKIAMSKLYITAKSPVVIQELNLVKNKLLQKVNMYSSPIGIEIKDLVFNYKNFDEITKKENEYIEDKPTVINNLELDKIKLNEEIEKSYERAVDKISFLSDGQKKKLTNKILQNFKAQTLRKNIQNE